MRFNYQFYWCILITWIFEMVLEKSYITNWGLRIRKLVMKCKKYLLIFRQESLVGKVPKYAISPSWFVYRQLAFFPSFCASSRNWILNWQEQIYIYIYICTLVDILPLKDFDEHVLGPNHRFSFNRLSLCRILYVEYVKQYV